MFDKMFKFSNQLALFVSSGSVRADELSYLVRSKMEVGEFEPMLIPEQPGMPAEIPRLHINTDSGYRLAMSKSRIDLTVEIPFGIMQEEEDRFSKNCAILMSILRERKIDFDRVGWVGSWFAEVDNAGSALASSLLKVADREVSDMNVSITQKKNINDITCNSLFSFANGTHQSGMQGIIVARDVNTVPSNGMVITCDQADTLIFSFAKEASKQSVLDFLEA